MTSYYKLYRIVLLFPLLPYSLIVYIIPGRLYSTLTYGALAGLKKATENKGYEYLQRIFHPTPRASRTLSEVSEKRIVRHMIDVAEQKLVADEELLILLASAITSTGGKRFKNQLLFDAWV